MSLINKYTKDIKDVNSHKRSNLERKRSEVILRLSELDEAVKSAPPPPPSIRNRTAINQRTRGKMSGAQRRKLALERAKASSAPILNKRKPRTSETTASGKRMKKSPRRTSIARKRSPGRDTHKITGNSRSPINRTFRPASEKYDPAFPTSNDLNRDLESLRFRPTAIRDRRRSRSPIQHSTNNKNIYSRHDKIKGRSRSPNIRSINNRNRPTRSRSPGHIERDRQRTSPDRLDRDRQRSSPGRLDRDRQRSSPGRLDRDRQRTSPGRFDRDRQHTSPGRFDRNRNTRYSSRSPGLRSSSNVYGQRDSKTDSNSRDRDSRRYGISTHGNDFNTDQYFYTNNRPNAAFNFDIPTNYANEFIEGNFNITDRDSRWHDTSRAIHSYSQSDAGRIFNQIDRSRYPNDMNVDNVASRNADRLRSRGSDYLHPLYTNSRTREDVQDFRDVPVAPSASTSSVRRPIDSPPKIKRDLIRISIVPVDYPKVTLSKSQADDIELALISHIKPGAAGTGPQFSYISFLQRTLVAGCKNIETTKWLKDTVPKLDVPNVGPLKILTTKELFKSGTFPKVTMFVPNPIAKKPASTLLTLIETQNVGLHTENWRILGSTEKPGGLSMALLIDNTSLATLEKLELRACLGLTQAKFTVIRGKREQ